MFRNRFALALLVAAAILPLAGCARWCCPPAPVAYYAPPPAPACCPTPGGPAFVP